MTDISLLTETTAWYWLAYASGLGLRRAKSIVRERVLARGITLAAMLQEPPQQWGAALGLTAEEAKTLTQRSAGMSDLVEQDAPMAGDGPGTAPAGRAILPSHPCPSSPPTEQPLLLAYRGEPGLLDLPLVLPVAGDPPDASALAWTLETLLSLATEGALPLLIARPGFEADVARGLLLAEAPLALVIPQGLAAYTPPSSLAAAMASGRVLLLNPFQLDAAPTDGEPNPMLTHAAKFAQAIAHALLIVSVPHPDGLLPEQPCFLRPGLPQTVGCQAYYSDPEDFFLRLVDIPTAAANASLEPPAAPSPPPEPSLPPDELIARLSASGHVPETLKARLHAGDD